ncbi:MAG: tyrosine-type recombinase/integrase [Pseudonocardia sp.]
MLLIAREEFVGRYPSMARWARRPVAERLGPTTKAHWPPTTALVDHTAAAASHRARPYLLYLSLTGRLRLDWPWLFGAGNLRILAIADGLGLPLRTQMDALQHGLPRQVSKHTIARQVPWALPRLILHRADPDLTTLTLADVDELRQAIRNIHALPGIEQLDLKIHERSGFPMAWHSSATQTGVALFHAGFIEALPLRKQPRRLPAISAVPAIEEVMQRYLRELAIRRSPGTVTQARSALLRLAAWHAETRPEQTNLASLDRTALLEFLAWLPHQRKWKHPDQPLSAVYREHVVGHVARFFRHAAAHEWPDMPTRPPLTSSDVPRKVERVPRFIPAEELDLLMDRIRALTDPLQRTALLVARWSGARSGEIHKLDLDCLDTYPDGTHRLRLAAGKSAKERVVPIHPEAAAAVAALIARRREQTDQPLFDTRLGRKVRFLFLRNGRLASQDYLFKAGLVEVCRPLGLVDTDGRALVHPHRFRHTIGTQLGERGAKIQTIMKVLGHRSAGMSMTYTSLSDPVVLADYQAVLTPGAVLAGPQAEAIRNGELTQEAVNWLSTNFYKTELELGRCLRLPQEGPCECDLYLTCSKFVTTPDYTPRLRTRLRTEEQLICDAEARGWDREAERHRRTARRIQELLDELGAC